MATMDFLNSVKIELLTITTDLMKLESDVNSLKVKVNRIIDEIDEMREKDNG